MNSIFEYYKDIQHIREGQRLLNENFFDDWKDYGLWHAAKKKIKEWASDFSKWLLNTDEKKYKYSDDTFLLQNDDVIGDRTPEEYLDDNFNTKYLIVDTKETNINVIKKIIKVSGTDAKNKQGFWLFAKDIYTDSAENKKFSQINSGDYKIHYIIFYYKDKNVNDVAGMVSWSDKTNSKDHINGLENYLHIYTIQTAKKFKGHHLFNEYFKTLRTICKDNYLKGMTIEPYSNEIIPIYKKYGFEETKIKGKTHGNKLMKYMYNA